MEPEEATIQVWAVPFPLGVRDFLLVRQAEGVVREALHPLDLLSLDRALAVIQRVGSKNEELALHLSLCRLLVPCLKYRGSNRHLVIEPWSLSDVNGAALPVDVPTDFARDLSAAQARAYRAVTTGESPPAGSLAELFWASQTDLPALADVFEDDPEMSLLAKALYVHLIPAGSGTIGIDTEALAAKVAACRADRFASLGLEKSPRKLQQAFRRLLALTVRYASQLTGQVAAELVDARLRRAGHPLLTEHDRKLLDLRYGACRALNDLNISFLFGCGPLLARLVNDYHLTIAEGVADERLEAEELLRKFVYLLARYQERRKQARAQERRDDRQRRADRLPGSRRRQAKYQEDRSEPAPEANAASHETMAYLELMLPSLRAWDAERLKAFIDCERDRKAAAEKLGLGYAAYSRQLRQTVFPAIRKLARKQKFNPFA